MENSQGATVRHKNKHRAAVVNFMQDENERQFLCAAVPWRYAGHRRRGGVREVDRGAVEDTGGNRFLFV